MKRSKTVYQLSWISNTTCVQYIKKHIYMYNVFEHYTVLTASNCVLWVMCNISPTRQTRSSQGEIVSSEIRPALSPGDLANLEQLSNKPFKQLKYFKLSSSGVNLWHILTSIFLQPLQPNKENWPNWRFISDVHVMQHCHCFSARQNATARWGQQHGKCSENPRGSRDPGMIELYISDLLHKWNYIDRYIDIYQVHQQHMEEITKE